MTEHSHNSASNSVTTVDVVVVGAGFAGLYQLHRLRKAGFSTTVIEAADDVGGTWYWNRYPGARCDILTVDYSYSWDPELQQEWQWSERYATQPEILRYAQFVADKHDLRRDISFGTRVESARWNEETKHWTIRTDKGDDITARFYVMATGCLSMPKVPDVPGADNFGGDTYFTSSWPHEGVDLSGKRVAVIGTGSSGIQSIPLIAEEAAQLTVFQRTPNFSFPAHNGPVANERLEDFRNDPAAYRQTARESIIGVPAAKPTLSALQVSDEERNAVYEEVWQTGELARQVRFNDIQTNPAANDTLRRFIHNKIKDTVDDPETAKLLCPDNHYVFTKRPCLDTNYFQTFNLPHVRLVDLHTQPITSITTTGIETGGSKTETLAFDAIVFATGFDAMTGAIVGVDITGRDGVTLSKAWDAGPVTYLGLMTVGFPNFFMITGPGSPSVLSNMMVSIEQHVDLITRTLEHLRAKSFDSIEPTPLAQERWVKYGNDFANLTLAPTANSWYMGRNVPGKPQVFLPYIGGVGRYRDICNEIVDRDYLGFVLDGPQGKKVQDGVIRPVAPDMTLVLEMIAETGAPPFESVPVADARAMAEGLGAMFPAGPEVGDVVDGTLPGADGSELEYRLYRPATPGPHPIVVYFHGGGWVLGSHVSDGALCRDLCNKSNAIFVSVNYRHAPEHRFPAAADDGLAATSWIAEHARDLGGISGQLIVAGYSAGANIAAVTAQQAKLAGGPDILGQILLTPVVDGAMNTQSFIDNAEGYTLTAPLMSWFWDHYCDAEDRSNPKASPLLADDLSGLPQAMVITCEFDPLRDEGDAYAKALRAAGVPVRHLQIAGHTHMSVGWVDVIVSAAFARTEMAEAIQQFFRR